MIESMQTMLDELQQETPTTRRLLEPVPGDKLAWKPHRKSMSLGHGAAEEYLHRISEKKAAGTWRLPLRGKEVFTIPRPGLLRSLMLNHWYHHRGQLSVYLRLLDVPLPVIYGRSADENPFV